MISVTKIFNISYGHRLIDHPGKCSRLHGHNGKVEVTLYSPSRKVDSSTGMVVDFDDINKTIGIWLNQTFDHRTILQVSDPIIHRLCVHPGAICESIVTISSPPTAEVLAGHILDKVIEYFPKHNPKVRFYETEDNYAEVSY